MIMAKNILEQLKEIKDSNRTAKLVDIIDLSIDRVKEKLEK